MKIKKRKLFGFALISLMVFSFAYMKYHNLTFNAFSLKILTLVKKIKGSSVDLVALEDQATKTMQHDSWSKLLAKHVTVSGTVDYKGFIQDSTQLQSYLTALSEHIPGPTWTKDEKLAYWINAYNAFTVKLIIDHYPLESIKDISKGLPMINSPWDIKFFKIGSLDFDLNTIEHEILRKQFDEPRIHFAINCASFSCPKLRNEAFVASELEEQLQEQAIAFINNPDKNIINSSETKLSKIFNWFRNDFTRTTALLDYIQEFNPALNKANKIEYLEYQWTLNTK